MAIVSGVLGGAVTTLTAFKTRLAMLDRDIAEERRLRHAQMDVLDSRLSLVSRQQFLCLQILSDVAGKVGADNRFTDQVMKFLANADRDMMPVVDP